MKSKVNLVEPEYIFYVVVWVLLVLYAVINMPADVSVLDEILWSRSFIYRTKSYKLLS